MVAAAILFSGWLSTRAPARSAPRGGGRGSWTPRWMGKGEQESDANAAQWARRRDLRSLIVPAPTAGRLTVGVACRRLVATDPGHSLLVVGPTQSFKTTGLAVPALLEWQGPVLAASVKGDLVHDTVAWRRRQGTVWIYDPSASTSLETAPWSPLATAGTWAGA